MMITPVIVPSIITAIAMYYLAGKLGLIGNSCGSACATRYRDADRVTDPVVGLARCRPDLERAALGLGSSRVRVFSPWSCDRVAGG